MDSTIDYRTINESYAFSVVKYWCIGISATPSSAKCKNVLHWVCILRIMLLHNCFVNVLYFREPRVHNYINRYTCVYILLEYDSWVFLTNQAVKKEIGGRGLRQDLKDIFKIFMPVDFIISGIVNETYSAKDEIWNILNVCNRNVGRTNEWFFGPLGKPG